MCVSFLTIYCIMDVATTIPDLREPLEDRISHGILLFAKNMVKAKTLQEIGVQDSNKFSFSPNPGTSLVV